MDNREAAEAALGDSTVLNPEQPSARPLSDAAFEAPKQETAPDAPKHPTTREAIEKALEEAEAKDKPSPEKAEKPETGKEAKDDEKAEKTEEGKAEKPRAQDGKFAKAEPKEDEESKSAPEKAATGQDGTDKSRQSEGRDRHEPPARFLPAAKEKWANVPREVKAEVARLVQEHDTELLQYRESHEEYAKLSKFTDMAKQHNVTVSDALERYTAVDAMLHKDPVEGIRRVLETVGITPEQYARHVLQNPQASQPPPQPRTPDPVVSEVQSLRQQVSALMQSQQEQAARAIIEPFRAEHPRYDELQEPIARFLSSGFIPASLSPQDKLAAAYDMAVRINPTSSVQAAPAREEPATPTPTPDPVVDPRGQKSIKGAPASGQEPSAKRFKSNRDAANAALAELGI